jgi:hypothetical protein
MYGMVCRLESTGNRHREITTSNTRALLTWHSIAVVLDHPAAITRDFGPTYQGKKLTLLIRSLVCQ